MNLEDCPRCHGLGWDCYRPERDCYYCGGSGKKADAYQELQIYTREIEQHYKDVLNRISEKLQELTCVTADILNQQYTLMDISLIDKLANQAIEITEAQKVTSWID